MIIRATTLSAVLPATDPTDASRRCDRIEIRPDGTVTATDGHVLLSATERHRFDDVDYPTKGVPHFTGNVLEAVLLPVPDAKALIKGTSQTKRSAIPILKAVQLGQNGDGPYAAATDLQATVTVRVEPASTAAGKFPGWDRIIPPADRAAIAVTLSVEVLETLYRAALAASPSKDNPTVTLRIPTAAHYQGNRPSDHDFDGDTSNGKGCSCGHDHVGGKGNHYSKGWGTVFGGDGQLVSAMRVEITGEDVTIVGAVMPCR